MSAKEQLLRLVRDLDDAQSDRALSALEAAADWVLTGDRPALPEQPSRSARGRAGAGRTAAEAVGSRPREVRAPVVLLGDSGRHRGLTA